MICSLDYVPTSLLGCCAPVACGAKLPRQSQLCAMTSAQHTCLQGRHCRYLNTRHTFCTIATQRSMYAVACACYHQPPAHLICPTRASPTAILDSVPVLTGASHLLKALPSSPEMCSNGANLQYCTPCNQEGPQFAVCLSIAATAPMDPPLLLSPRLPQCTAHPLQPYQPLGSVPQSQSSQWPGHENIFLNRPLIEPWVGEVSAEPSAPPSVPVGENTSSMATSPAPPTLRPAMTDELPVAALAAVFQEDPASLSSSGIVCTPAARGEMGAVKERVLGEGQAGGSAAGA
mmetsp:Transcript_6231/g.15482  ORF Transcript_6231/g.15482 Transcript_6231/m.15482 type:complete len:289 (+) Transcript_6231:171-1037(+)